MDTRVRFHRDQELAFPPVCVGCNSTDPQDGFALPRWSSAANALKLRRVRVPACAACAKRMRRIRTTRTVWFVGGLVAAGAAMFFLRRVWSPAIVGAVAVCATLIPLGVVETFRPRPVRIIRARGARALLEANYITLEFGNPTYAETFGRLNPPRK